MRFGVKWLILTHLVLGQVWTHASPLVQQGEWPELWKGASCESVQFFHQQRNEFYKKVDKDWSLQRLLQMSAEELEEYFETIYFKRISLIDYPLDAEFVQVELELDSLLPGDISEVTLGLNGFRSGIVFMTPWLQQFHGVQWDGSSKKLSVPLNHSDICFAEKISIKVFSQCTYIPHQNFCIGSDCVEIINGFSPNQCEKQMGIDVSLAELKTKLNAVDQHIQWEGQND